jgi:hypothetical protein
MIQRLIPPAIHRRWFTQLVLSGGGATVFRSRRRPLYRPFVMFHTFAASAAESLAISASALAALAAISLIMARSSASRTRSIPSGFRSFMSRHALSNRHHGNVLPFREEGTTGPGSHAQPRRSRFLAVSPVHPSPRSLAAIRLSGLCDAATYKRRCPQHGEGLAGAGPSAASIIESDLRLATLSRAWCGLLESRSGELKIQLKLCCPHPHPARLPHGPYSTVQGNGHFWTADLRVTAST